MKRLPTATLVLALPLLAQGAKDKPAPDPQIERVNELYAELLQLIEKHRVDPRRDGIAVIHERREAVARALDAFRQGALDGMFDRRHLGIDYVRFVDRTLPRLDGRVLRVGAGETLEDLLAAMDQIQPGVLVLLGPGKHTLPDFRRELRDVAFLGAGPEQTTLMGRLEQGDRVQLAGMRIDCQDSVFLDLRGGGAIQLQKCTFANYNSGAGGSNAIFGVGTTLLVEDCTFEGLSGRREKSGSGGSALDLRGTNFLYVRRTEFEENSEIVRASSFCVFDRCRSVNRNRNSSGIMPYDSGFLLVRQNGCKIRGNATGEFPLATDDRDVVRHLVGRRAAVDPATKAAVEALGLRDNPRYWATLLHHEDQEVRFMAQGRLATLMRGTLPKFRPSKAMLAQVPKELRKPFDAVLRSAHALAWLDANDANLVWDKKTRAYRLPKGNDKR